jgi:tRNA A-37 threonylcarbamoyl transferase component Bud32
VVPSPELEDTAVLDVSARERFSVLPVEFGRFRVLEKLGEGGFARVFRAELEGHEGFRKTVALKVIRPRDEKANVALRDALTNEARLGALLRHTNTVDIYDFGEQDGLLYIAMEYVDGRPLDRLLAETGALPGPVLLDLAAQICAGLHHAHTLRDGGKEVTLIHRDLKPANILLTPDGVAKVADFGIAKALGERHERPATKAGVAKGTPPYMSPEQLRSETLTPASDLFAMGCIIYQLATGKLLFNGPSTAAVVLAIVQVQQRLAGGDIQAEADARVPGLGSVLEWCLQPNSEDRYPNAAALRSALLDLRGRLGGGATLEDFLSGRDLEVLVGAAALETVAYRLEGSDVTDQGEHALETPDLRKTGHAKHVRALAFLNILHGVASVGIASFVGVARGFEGGARSWSFGTALVGAAFVLVGIGLLRGVRAARPAALGLGLLCLFKFPVGTPLGIYAIWLLVFRKPAEPTAG